MRNLLGVRMRMLPHTTPCTSVAICSLSMWVGCAKQEVHQLLGTRWCRWLSLKHCHITLCCAADKLKLAWNRVICRSALEFYTCANSVYQGFFFSLHKSLGNETTVWDIHVPETYIHSFSTMDWQKDCNSVKILLFLHAGVSCAGWMFAFKFISAFVVVTILPFAEVRESF